MHLKSLSTYVSAGKNIGNITYAINKTVIKGTPLQNSINPIDEYLTIGKLDLLPRAKKIPRGKHNSIAKIAIINVKESPPQTRVSTSSKIGM